MWMVSGSDWRNRGFYESWRILRREYKARIGEEPKFRDMAKILDAALLEYIVSEYNPNVDLQSALSDYLICQDLERVVRAIRDGKYRVAYTPERIKATRPKVGNLYREREKA